MSFGTGARRRPITMTAMAVGASLFLGATAALPQDQGTSGGEQAQPKAEKKVDQLTITYLRQLTDDLPPLSLLDIPPKDDGIAGARLAINDNNTTGQFMNQKFQLDVLETDKPEDIVAHALEKAGTGDGFFVTDLPAKTLLAVSDALKDKAAVIINAGAHDNDLREENCRLNVKHTAPSRAMLADALAQYMAWKRWRRWFLVVGPKPEDEAFAVALRRAANRFGLKIVEERTFTYKPGARRTDGGFEQVQQQIPSFTQKAEEHDVQVVADEDGLFAEYFPYRTWDAKPVIGSAGLYPTSWHPAMEQWGATQFQNRFRRLANRRMRALDYNAWAAVRALGEAATRKRSTQANDIIEYLRSPQFELAAFKGLKLTFRDWNGQLRQPILLATGKLPVTVSPQQGFLHQRTELDTLGIDKPETKCEAYRQ